MDKKKDGNSKHCRYCLHILLTIAKSSDQVGKFFHIIISIKVTLPCIFHLLISFATEIFAPCKMRFQHWCGASKHSLKLFLTTPRSTRHRQSHCLTFYIRPLSRHGGGILPVERRRTRKSIPLIDLHSHSTPPHTFSTIYLPIHTSVPLKPASRAMISIRSPRPCSRAISQAPNRRLRH